jgi:hypothetical protein
MFDELDGGKGRISVAKLDAGLAKLDKAAHRRSFEAKRALCAVLLLLCCLSDSTRCTHAVRTVSGSITRSQFIALFKGEHYDDDDDDEDDDDDDDEDDDDVIDELLKAKKSGDVFVHVVSRPNAPFGVWKRRFGLLNAKFFHHGSTRNRVFDCRIAVQGSRLDAAYVPSSTDAKRAHAFTLETASGELFYIAANDELERAEWIAALAAVARDRADAPPTALSRAADLSQSSEPRRGVDAKPAASSSSASAAAALHSDRFGGPLSVAADRVGVAPKSPRQRAAYSAVPDPSLFDSQNGNRGQIQLARPPVYGVIQLSPPPSAPPSEAEASGADVAAEVKLLRAELAESAQRASKSSAEAKRLRTELADAEGRAANSAAEAKQLRAQLAAVAKVLEDARATQQQLAQLLAQDPESELKLQIAEAQAEVQALRRQLESKEQLRKAASAIVVPIEINAADLDFDAAKVELGRGAAAVVYAATLRGEPVAVKEMHGEVADMRNAVAQELAIAHRLIGHANIVTTFGVVGSGDHLCLVMERLPLTLSNVLHGSRDKAAVALTGAQRLAIAHGVASGLRFCHAQSPPVLHRDLKPGNVLMSEDLRTIKLCDFGSARAVVDAASMTLGVGTTQYMAPEVLNPPDDGAVHAYDAKIDVYSFGVLLWELFAAAKPFAHLQPAQIPIAVCVKKARPSPDPASSPATILALMKRCWSHEPAERPTMTAAIGPLAQALMQADEAAKEAAEARNECVVCADAKRSVAFVPCGHVCSCVHCADESNQCPICRVTVAQRLKVFLA